MTAMGIEDTSKRDPMDHLGGGLLGQGHYIESMEAAGQHQLVHSDRLPVELQHPDSREDFEALGFVFGEPDPVDPIFVPVTLPEGWSKQGSDHDMWSYVVDERGVKRVAVFYKAAYYDRHAFMRLERVGASLASEFAYYGTEPPWFQLTAEEQEMFVVNLRHQAEVYTAERDPERHQRVMDRLTALDV